MKSPRTPLLKQYFGIKESYPDVLMAMRVGDFYEFYGDDAVSAVEALEIVLTGKDDGSNGKVPMAGVPFHSAQRYFAKLVEKGFKVGICDQLEDPKSAKGLVKRGVTRVLTSGTLVEDHFLHPSKNNFLTSVVLHKKHFGIVNLDISTGEFFAAEIVSKEGEGGDLFSSEENIFATSDVPKEIHRLYPSELITSSDLAALIQPVVDTIDTVLTIQPCMDMDTSKNLLSSTLGINYLKRAGIESSDAIILASGMLLNYVKSMGLNCDHLENLQIYSIDRFMMLDNATRKSLEITENLMDGSKNYTLLKSIDKTKTTMGGRLIRRWVHEPLLDTQEIQNRLDGVEELLSSSGIQSNLYESLKHIGDLERLSSRISMGLAGPKDLIALAHSLLAVPKCHHEIIQLKSNCFKQIEKGFKDYGEVVEWILSGIVEEPPVHLRDGGVIADGFDKDLDNLRHMVRDAKEYIAKLEHKAKEEIGVPTVKVGYNSVFGYYIEVSKLHSSKVPEYYIRKQTTANAERYITADLKSYESTVLNAHEKIVAMESEIFKSICFKLKESIADFMATAKSVATIDVLLSFATVANSNKYVKPTFTDKNCLEIISGRHPVVEQECGIGEFVPNNLTFEHSNPRLMILTGPNMSGKSTFLRQSALIVLMAQIGCFVPAESCHLSVCDRIFTRIGAKDEIALGQSTFMIEMLECANILKNATPDSLLILDEVGRGTSTYDGLAIAWSMVEYLSQLKAKTLFATHYHQLNSIAKQNPVVTNYRVMVEEDASEIIWTHRVVPGGADKSYGIHVAKMAGVPSVVIQRANEILSDLEGKRLYSLALPVQRELF